MPDILENGEDVTNEPPRALILRAVNASLRAESLASKLDELASGVRNLEAKFDAILELWKTSSRGEAPSAAE